MRLRIILLVVVASPLVQVSLLVPLQVAGVEHALGHPLSCAKCSRLTEHRIDQGGLAMVYVRDDRDVAQVIAGRQRACGH